MPGVQRGLRPRQRRWLPDERSATVATLAYTGASAGSVLGSFADQSVACSSTVMFCWPFLNMKQMRELEARAIL